MSKSKATPFLRRLKFLFSGDRNDLLMSPRKPRKDKGIRRTPKALVPGVSASNVSVVSACNYLPVPPIGADDLEPTRSSD